MRIQMNPTDGVVIPNHPMFLAGESYDVPDEIGKLLLDRGHAVMAEVPEKKKSKPAPTNA